MITGGKKAVAVIGEGITEKYYIESLRGLVGRNFQILPQQLGLKASSLVELEKAIMKAVDEGHDEVYCLIDMDSKEAGAGVQKYEKLKICARNRDCAHGKIIKLYFCSDVSASFPPDILLCIDNY